VQKILVTLSAVELLITEHDFDADYVVDFGWLIFMLRGGVLLSGAGFGDYCVCLTFEL
jgi:hypothetical protein